MINAPGWFPKSIEEIRDYEKMKYNKRTQAFLERMERGKQYEKKIRGILDKFEIKYKTQVHMKFGDLKYIADFVLHGDTIIESTDSNLEVARGIEFIDKKIEKLNIVTNEYEYPLVIVTTHPEGWQEAVPKAICITEEDLIENFETLNKEAERARKLLEKINQIEKEEK